MINNDIKRKIYFYLMNLSVFPKLLEATSAICAILDIHNNDQCMDVHSIGRCKKCRDWFIKFSMGPKTKCKHPDHTILVRINDGLQCHDCILSLKKIF